MKGDWGNSCKHISRHKESIIDYYNSFQDLSEKFFHPKATDFFNFLSLYKCRKILTIKTTLMSLNWVIMDQTMRRIYTTTHTSQFPSLTDAFQLQISAHKKYALSGHFS